VSRFESRERLASKIDWEGGLLDAIDYGIKATDMPEGDDELAKAWKKLEDAYSEVVPHAAQVSALLDLW
jgi:hypothetical protein